MKYIRLLSPFLLAILSVTSMWSANANRFGAEEMGTPLVFALLVAGFFLLMFWLSHWTAHSAPVAATVSTLLFLMWYEWPWPVSVFLFIATLFFCVYKDFRPHVRHVQNFLPFFLALCIVVTLIAGALAGGPFPHVVAEDHPYITGQRNIYFICPDRMPSPEAMAESGIDAGWAVDALREMGFIVPWSLSSSDPYTVDYSGSVHTTRTMRFMAEVLNDGEPVPIDISYSDCRRLIQDPALFQELHDRGYMITNVGSWFTETASFPTADTNLRYTDVGFIERMLAPEFNRSYYQRTIMSRLNIKLWESAGSIQKVERGRHQWAYYELLGIATSAVTSQLTIAHIMLPHEPFVHTEWETRDPDNYKIKHWFENPDPHPDQMQQYLDQIRYALGYIVDLAESIRNTDPDAVIVIQSDEGMAFRKPKSINEELSPVQWNGVFGAWYFPDRPELGLEWVPEEHYEILKEVIL